jgi:hypothetical protein
MAFISMGNTTVNVSVKESDIYFNDARVIRANVLYALNTMTAETRVY